MHNAAGNLKFVSRHAFHNDNDNSWRHKQSVKYSSRIKTEAIVSNLLSLPDDDFKLCWELGVEL